MLCTAAAIALAWGGTGTASIAKAAGNPLPGAVRTAPSPADWAPARTAAIRPGVVTVTAGGGMCTGGFVFTSGYRTFIGQAAHCAGTGDATETDGCDSTTLPLGTIVTIRGADGTDRLGTLAYSSWITMQANGESDPDVCAFNDFALVEIDPTDVGTVNPSVPIFGGPTGLDTDGLVVGEQVETSGPLDLDDGVGGVSGIRVGGIRVGGIRVGGIRVGGIRVGDVGGVRVGDITAGGIRVGVSAGDTGGGRGHDVYTVAPGVPGESGSAYLDAAGAAVGLLSTLNLSPLPMTNGIVDIALAMAYATTNGGLGDIELALGTEPFTAGPAGVPATDLAGPAGPPLA